MSLSKNFSLAGKKKFLLEESLKKTFLEVFDDIVKKGEVTAENIKRIEILLCQQEKKILRLHRSGAPGELISQVYCECYDFFLPLLSQSLEQLIFSQEEQRGIMGEWVLVAFGGYGRCDIAPRSDVDLIWIYRGQKISLLVEELITRSLKFLWDIGWHIGYATYSLEETEEEGKKKKIILTNFLEARYIAGSRDLWKDFEIKREGMRGESEYSSYLEWRLEDIEKMQKKYRKNLLLQEPHLKYGRGGLRYYQSLRWISLMRYDDHSWESFLKKKFLQEREAVLLDNAYDFLLTVRHELHFQQGRRHDQLSLPFHAEVAMALGYEAVTPIEQSELLMKDYYQATRHITLVGEALLKRLQEEKHSSFSEWMKKIFQQSYLSQSLGEEKEKEEKKVTYEDFLIQEGVIFVRKENLFEKNPYAFFQAFLLMQLYQSDFSTGLEDKMKESLTLVDENLRNSPRAAALFLQILSERGKVAGVLRKMHNLGFLGAYLPEFEALTCLVQYEVYHCYTVDEHTLVAIDQLDALLDHEEGKLRNYRELFMNLDHVEILYLALLLHDTGKAFDVMGHTSEGEKIAERVAQRFHLKDSEVALLKRLVKIHVSLSLLARTRDLEEVSTVKEMVTLVQDQRTLDLLMLMTLVDGMAVSDEKWSDWKEFLVWKLYYKTKAYLKKGTKDLLEFYDEERYQVEEYLLKKFPPSLHKIIRMHCREMTPRYFKITDLAKVEEHLVALTQLLLEKEEKKDSYFLFWEEKEGSLFTRLSILTRDKKYFIRALAAALMKAGIEVISANSFVATDYFIDDFWLSSREYEGFLGEKERNKVARFLEEFLAKDILEREEAFLKARKMLLQQKEKKEKKKLQEVISQVLIDDQKHPHYTIVDIRAPDRIGLFYDLITEFKKHHFFITAIRVHSKFGVAFDSFYLVDQEGKKIPKSFLEGSFQKNLMQVVTSQ